MTGALATLCVSFAFLLGLRVVMLLMLGVNRERAGDGTPDSGATIVDWPKPAPPTQSSTGNRSTHE